MKARWLFVLLGLLMSAALRGQDLAADFTWSPSQPKVGEAVQLDPSLSTGNPTQFQWTTSNNLSSNESSPSFTFTTAGTYEVTLVVSRSGPTGLTTSRTTKSLVVSGTIRLDGPRTAETGKPITLRARGEQCAPGAQGWVWETDGGDVAGAANGSTLQVSWRQTGRKTVRVRHPACGSISGTLFVEVSNVPQPRITVNGPLRGRVHQGLTFTAAAANCQPASNGWRWTAEGGAITSSPGNSMTATWTAAGSRRVTVRNTACGNATGEARVAIDSAIPLSANIQTTIDLPAQSAPRSIIFQAETALSCPIQVVARSTDGVELARGQVTPAALRAALGYLPASGWHLELTSQCNQLLGFDIATLSEDQVSPSSCPGGRSLCLQQSRFQVEVVWHSQNNGRLGVGRPITGSDQSGFFWFFDQENVELIVKILDPNNGKFWVFYGALSDVAYWIRITDTVTGAVRTYVNQQGQICGLGDTGAFIKSFGNEPNPDVFTGIEAFELDAEDDPELITGAAGSCVASSRTLCLLNKRFSARVDWRIPSTGQTGSGTTVPGSDKTGYFWFFDPSNLELVVKALDGVAFNGKYWLFYGALSDVAYTVTVTDTVTGKVKVYENPPGNICGVGDTNALSPEPATLQVTGPVSTRTEQHQNYTVTFDKCVPIPGAWSWTTSGGTITGNATGTSVDVSWANAGGKTVSARNPGCGNSRGSLSVEVEAAGAAPVADFLWSPSDPVAGQLVQFFDLSANQPDSWLWSFGDGATSTLTNPQHVFAGPGTYQVTLTVSNGFGNHQTSNTVVVGEAAHLPVPDFTWTPASPVAGQSVQFSGTATNNPLSFSWSFGDGSTATGAQVSHTFTAPGTYSVTLTATNNAGSDSVTQAVVVQPSAGCGLDSIELGQTVGGSWNAACLSTHRPDRYAQFYTFTLSAPTNVGIDLQSGQDGYLFLMTGSGFDGTVFAVNDDRGPGDLNPYLEVSLSPGSYTIEATTYDPAVSGSFTLSLSDLGGGGGGANITISGPTSGEVARFLQFTATATGCVPEPNEWTWAGIYSEWVDNISLAWGGPTSYDLTATNPGCPGAVGHLLVNIQEGPCFFAFGPGQTTSNSWNGSCSSSHIAGSYARYYAFSLGSQTTMVFTLSSAQADSYLFLLEGWGETGNVIASDDDGGGGLNSQITITLPPGFYTVEATTLTPGQTGDFTISAQ